MHWLLITDNTVDVDNKHLITAVLSCHPVSVNSGALGGAERLCSIWGSLPSLYTFPDPEFVRGQIEALQQTMKSSAYVEEMSQKKGSSAVYGEARLSWLAYAVDIYRGRQVLQGQGEVQMISELKREKRKREEETGVQSVINPDQDGPIFHAMIEKMLQIPGYSKTILQMNTRLEELRRYGGNCIELERELGICHYSDTRLCTIADRNRILQAESLTLNGMSLILAPLKRDFETSVQSLCFDYRQAKTKVY